MIGSLKGIVAGIYEDRAIIEVSGVGYLVFLGSSVLSRIKNNDAVHLFIETHVREDALKLFGFLSDIERAWFVRLQEVTGVGAKVALAILDILSPNQIIQAIEMGDKGAVGRATGVGPKLAQRIVTELKGRQHPPIMFGNVSKAPIVAGDDAPVDDFTPTISAMPVEELNHDINIRNNAISALENLGIGSSEAINAVAHAYSSFDKEPSLNDLVKQALKELKR